VVASSAPRGSEGCRHVRGCVKPRPSVALRGREGSAKLEVGRRQRLRPPAPTRASSRPNRSVLLSFPRALGVCLIAALAAPGLAWADQDAPGDDGAGGGAVGDDERAAVRELQRRILVEGGRDAEQAAAELFGMGRARYDAFLAETLGEGEPDGREARQAILRALSHAGVRRPQDAARLVFAALDDPLPSVAKLAADALVDLEEDRTHDVLRQELLRTLDARPDTAAGRRAKVLVAVLEGMRDKIESAGALVAMLQDEDITPALEQLVRETLMRMTACSFDGAAEWQGWYAETKEYCGGSVTRWRERVAAQQDMLLERYESEAERYFLRLVTALKDEPEALFEELAAALGPDTVPAVRRRAIQWLGTLGQEGNARAVSLLRSRLEASGTDYDEDVALAIQELGRLADPALFEDIVRFLGREYHPRMRVAAVRALGKLQAPEGAAELLALIEDPDTPHDLLEVVVDSLGRIGHDPEGRVSTALTALARQHLDDDGGIDGPVATGVLKVTAEALSRLPYADGVGTTNVATLLRRLVAADDANVRLYAVTALGRLPDPSAFGILSEQLGTETVLRVRKALLDAVGQQGVQGPEHAGDAIRILVPFLDDPEETGALRRISRKNLEQLVLAERDPDLSRRTLVVETLLQLRPETGMGLILPFLSDVPLPSALPTDAPAQVRARALDLLGIRARGRLATDRPGAVTDIRTILAAGRASQAFELALGLIANGADGEGANGQHEAAWGVALDAVEAVGGVDAALVPGLLGSLRPHLESAPEAARRRFAAISADGSGGGS